MDQEHLEFIMRHQGMMGFPVSRCDSEEALGSSESEPAAARPRGKRARAAEVHNLSEKMLSMRNGLYRPLVNLPGAPEPLPTLQMCTALNQKDAEASKPTAAMLPMTQIFGAISGARHSFDPSNQDRRHHEPLVLPSVPCTTTPEPRFLLGSSQPHLQSLQFTVSAEMILQDEVMLKHHLSSTPETTSAPGHEMKPVRHETTRAGVDSFGTCSIWKRQPQDMMPSNTESVLFMPHFRRFQSSDTDSGLRTGSK